MVNVSRFLGLTATITSLLLVVPITTHAVDSPDGKYSCLKADPFSTPILYKISNGTPVVTLPNKAITKFKKKLHKLNQKIAFIGGIGSPIQKDKKSTLKDLIKFLKGCKNNTLDFEDNGGDGGGDPNLPPPDGSPSPSPSASASPSPSVSPSISPSPSPSPPATSQYDPSWGNISPIVIKTINYDPNKTSTANGTALVSMMNSLNPGDKLVIGGGTYTLTNNFTFLRSGSSTRPIFIVAKDNETPIIYRAAANHNGMEVGSGSTTVSYVLFRGLEINGGSIGVRIHKASNVWFDLCTIHDVADGGLSTNTQNTDQIYITRNHIYNTGGYGEGMYLGANNGAVIMSNSIIALNHVHDTAITNPIQGDGIELKQGSYGNLIAENLVHDTRYPGILVYGTAGMPVNIIEKNIVYNSGDNTMQVQGEAIVRNNLIMNGVGYAFASFNHQGTVTNLKVIHNTIINTGRAFSVSSWANKTGMVFANNVSYSQSNYGIMFSGGSAGVTVAGNVVKGTVSGVSSGYILGNGLQDFQNLTWNATALNAKPSASSPIIGAGNATYEEPEDITNTLRTGSVEAGCYDLP